MLLLVHVCHVGWKVHAHPALLLLMGKHLLLLLLAHVRLLLGVQLGISCLLLLHESGVHYVIDQ